AGKKDAILMVEGGMSQVSEEIILEALELAQKEINRLCDLQLRLVAETEKAGRKIVKRSVVAPQFPEPVRSFVTERARPEVIKALRAAYKHKHGLSEHLKPPEEALK